MDGTLLLEKPTQGSKQVAGRFCFREQWRVLPFATHTKMEQFAVGMQG